MIATGLHVVTKDAMPRLELPESAVRVGILDLLRLIEGLADEPAPGEPLVVEGVARLLMASDERTAVLGALRESLVAARGYFAWKAIALVVVLDVRVDDAAGGRGLDLFLGDAVVPLSPLFGTRLTRARPTESGWWHAPQIG